MAVNRPLRQFTCAEKFCGKVQRGVGRWSKDGVGPLCLDCLNAFGAKTNLKEDLGEPDRQFDLDEGSVHEARGRARPDYGYIAPPKSMASDRTRSPGRAPVNLGDDQFAVKWVKDERVAPAGGLGYMVSWEGCEEKDDQWKPAADVHPDLIAKFREWRSNLLLPGDMEEEDDEEDTNIRSVDERKTERIGDWRNGVYLPSLIDGEGGDNTTNDAPLSDSASVDAVADDDVLSSARRCSKRRPADPAQHILKVKRQQLQQAQARQAETRAAEARQEEVRTDVWNSGKDIEGHTSEQIAIEETDDMEDGELSDWISNFRQDVISNGKNFLGPVSQLARNNSGAEDVQEAHTSVSKRSAPQASRASVDRLDGVDTYAHAEGLSQEETTSVQILTEVEKKQRARKLKRINDRVRIAEMRRQSEACRQAQLENQNSAQMAAQAPSGHVTITSGPTPVFDAGTERVPSTWTTTFRPSWIEHHSDGTKWSGAPNTALVERDISPNDV